MKKIKSILVAILAVLALAPNTFATGVSSRAVEIKSIEPEIMAGNPTVSEPTFDGLEMSLNVSFSAPNDSVKYKITIQNNTDTEYELSEETPFDDSEYVTFDYELENDTLVAQGEAVVYLTLTYASAVPASEIGDSGYAVNNKATIKFTDQNGGTVNPNTADSSRSSMVIALIAATIAFAFIMLFSRRRSFAKRGIFGLILALCVIPLIASAAEKLSLDVNVHILIDAPKYEISYRGSRGYKWYSTAKYEFTDGYCMDSYYGVTAIYVGTKTESNKYRFCEYPILKKGSYRAGATVSVEGITFTSIGMADPIYCTDESDGSIICPTDQIMNHQYSIDYWIYTFSDSNDADVMNFSNAIDYEAGISLMIDLPASFTMPRHDVRFVKEEK